MTTAAIGPFFDVPATTRQERCRSCHAPIYWIRTLGGKLMPVDCAVEGGAPPVHNPPWPALPGRGVSHFATCPEADRWRKGR
jgi:hypothetical protein